MPIISLFKGRKGLNPKLFLVKLFSFFSEPKKHFTEIKQVALRVVGCYTLNFVLFIRHSLVLLVLIFITYQICEATFSSFYGIIMKGLFYF